MGSPVCCIRPPRHVPVRLACKYRWWVGGSPAPMNRRWQQFTSTINSFLHRVNGSSLGLCNCCVVATRAVIIKATNSVGQAPIVCITRRAGSKKGLNDVMSKRTVRPEQFFRCSFFLPPGGAGADCLVWCEGKTLPCPRVPPCHSTLR